MSHLKKYGFWYTIVLLMIVGVATYKWHPEYFDFILQPSTREIYERTLNEQPEKKKQWNLFFEQALKDQVLITEPYSENLITNNSQAFTAGYYMDIAPGESLTVSIPQNNDNLNWIIEVRNLDHQLLEDATFSNELLSLNYSPDTAVKIQIIVQATLETDQETELKIYKKPRFAFPVAGKGNDAIQSFWGASRGGGSRSHEGNDIFATKDHPVVAISNSRVASIRHRGLGGKQIWLKDSDTGLSLYYADLNGWNVEEGASVKLGDTIGFVGNTGNARTTPPHLHFGIYQNGKAIDPKAFIWKTDPPKKTVELPFIKNARASGFAANLRVSPQGKSDVIKDLKTEPLKIIGNSGSWYHVRTATGIIGFAHKSVVVEK